VILEIDVGNSRLKWRVRAPRDGGRQAGGAIPAAMPLPEPTPWAAFAPRRADVASVAGSELDAALRARLEADGMAVRFAVSGERCGRLRAGYREPARMGVDRWLALAAAVARAPGAVLVIDAGSALTLDVIGGDGRHVGGYIVPGLRLMRQALLGGTAGVRLEAEARAADRSPGRSTGEAVTHGALAMVGDFLRARVDAFLAAEAGAEARVLLTGGDAGTVAPIVPEAERHPELVLDGLAIVLDGPGRVAPRSPTP